MKATISGRQTVIMIDVHDRLHPGAQNEWGQK